MLIRSQVDRTPQLPNRLGIPLRAGQPAAALEMNRRELLMIALPRRDDNVLDTERRGDVDLSAGKFDAAIRNGHGQWAGLHTTELFPSVFMPLCAPALRAAAAAIADPREPLRVPLLGRSDWWQLWYRTLGIADAPALKKIGANLSAEYLDITQALAGDGIAIGSPILFRNEIDAGRLVPAHDLSVGDGRAFWFTVPVVRQDSPKIVQFRDWLCDEAASARNASADFLKRARVD